MDTFETVIFNRTKLMQVTACLMTLLTVGLLVLMIFFCRQKVIIVSDYEENTSLLGMQEESSRDIIWKIKAVNSSTDGIHFPVNTSDFVYDMDYVNKVFVLQIPDSKGKFYMENSPYGDFSFVRNTTARFDGEYVTYSFGLESCMDVSVTQKEGEVVFSFAPFTHEKPIVLVDPGHGGNAVGSMAGGLMEKEVDLKIAREVAKLAQGKDYSVVLSRNLDRKVGTGEIISIANLVEADYYIGIHLDADVEDTKLFGLRASYNPNYYRDGFENVDFADSLLRSVATSSCNKAIGLSKANNDELVLKVLKIPSSVLYLGYISNSSEAKLLSDDEYIEKLAEGVIAALDENIRTE